MSLEETEHILTRHMVKFYYHTVINNARCFAVAGPRTWNSLPIKLRQPDLSLEQFRRLLKTLLFS